MSYETENQSMQWFKFCGIATKIDWELLNLKT